MKSMSWIGAWPRLRLKRGKLNPSTVRPHRPEHRPIWPLSKLKASPSTVRRTRSEAAIKELAASIEAHGLLQMPVVRPEINGKGKQTGSYLVDVGESRRLALKLLAKRKRIKSDEPIAAP